MVKIEVIRGTALSNKELFGRSDPYVVVKFNGEKKRTGVCRGGGEFPIWQETLEFSGDSGEAEFKVYDKDLLFDDRMGKGSVDITKVATGEMVPVPLRGRFGRHHGYLEIRVTELLGGVERVGETERQDGDATDVEEAEEEVHEVADDKEEVVEVDEGKGDDAEDEEVEAHVALDDGDNDDALEEAGSHDGGLSVSPSHCWGQDPPSYSCPSVSGCLGYAADGEADCGSEEMNSMWNINNDAIDGDEGGGGVALGQPGCHCRPPSQQHYGCPSRPFDAQNEFNHHPHQNHHGGPPYYHHGPPSYHHRPPYAGNGWCPSFRPPYYQ